MSYKKVVISSGHGKHVAGAIGYLNEVNEARRVVNRVAELLQKAGCTVHKYHDDTSKDKNTNLKTIVKYHNSKTRDLDVSVHFNANKKTSNPMGCEVLYYNLKDFSVKLSKNIAKAGGFKDRGGKQRTDLYFLKNTNKPAVLIEVCFVDSEADKKLYEKNFEAICKTIAETISGKSISATSTSNTNTSKPTSATTSTAPVYRVLKDNVQVGAYSSTQNILTIVESSLKSGVSNIQIIKK